MKLTDRIDNDINNYRQEIQIGPLEFELNPIVRVYPPTGKRYPMRVIRQHIASFNRRVLF